jgi:ATP-binding cassette, subfamily B, bacterial
LERPELMNDLSMARDFDLGMMGPPLDISMDFIVGGLLDLVIGTAAGIVLAFWAWWAPIVLLIAWIATHYLLRESGVWKDRNNDDVRTAQRHAEYSYRLAVDSSPLERSSTSCSMKRPAFARSHWRCVC